jgi:hypothetical protein
MPENFARICALLSLWNFSSEKAPNPKVAPARDATIANSNRFCDVNGTGSRTPIRFGVAHVAIPPFRDRSEAAVI